MSAIDNMFNVGSTAACTAPASAGTFTVPPYVTLALPTGNFSYFELAPGVVEAAAQAPFTATGLNIGLIQAFVDGPSFGGFTLK